MSLRIYLLLLLCPLCVKVEAGNETERSTFYQALSSGPDGDLIRLSFTCARDCSRSAPCRGFAVSSPSNCLWFEDGPEPEEAMINLTNAIYYQKVSQEVASLLPRSCEDVRRVTGSDVTSGTYVVDPDGSGPVPSFTVSCLVSADGPLSVISHDRQSLSAVFASNIAYEPHYGYRHSITYEQTGEQLRALVTSSVKCRMQVNIVCYMVLFTDVEGMDLAGWVGYDGTVHSIRTGSEICPNLDSKGVRTCLCNNQAVERSESGNITDTSQFPVTALAFGDLGPGSEYLKIQIGQMKCSGIKECVAPPDIEFATKYDDGHEVGMVVSYFCFAGLSSPEEDKQTTITCQSNGSWSDPDFTRCQKL